MSTTDVRGGAGGGTQYGAPVADQRAGRRPPRAPGQGLLGSSYLGFIAGMTLSSLGDAAWYVALTWTLATAVSPAAAGALLALAALPRLVTLLVGGAVADRTGPRRVMVVTDVARAVVMVGAALAVLAIGPNVTVLVLAAAGLALLSAFFVPASGALRPQLLPESQLVRGNALYLIGLRGGQAAGGPLGALMLGIGGVALVAIANAATFLAAAGGVAKARPMAVPAPAVADRPRLLAAIGEGLRYVGRQRRILLLMLVIGLSELGCAGPLNLGLALLAEATGADATGAGLLLTAFTVGATISFLIALAWPARGRAGLVVGAGLLGQAVSLSMLAGITSFGWQLAAYVLLGLTSGTVGVVLVSLLQRFSDADVRSRVMSIQALLGFAAVPLGNVLIGVLIQLTGLQVTMLAHAAMCAAAFVVVALTASLRSASLA
jgi:MFS family permease